MMMDRSDVKFVFTLMLMTGIISTSAELLRPQQPPQINYAFNKFRPPPRPEPPTFIQRITSWFFPWGGVSNEEEFRLPASAKIDSQPPPQQYQNVIQHQQIQQPSRINPVHVRDTEPTTAKTTPRPPVSKCSPCNKEPWIPMMPTYQQPIVRPDNQQHLVYKHHFGNESPYNRVPSGSGYNYVPPSSTLPSSTTPIKFQDGNAVQGHHFYGAPPPIKFSGYQYTTQPPSYTRATSFRPNTNTIDTSVITFTTGRPQNNRPLRFTAAGSITNPEYILPPNRLPLEGENSKFAPIPIPNLSPTPIPPLFDAKPFNDNPYSSQKTGFIKLVPLDPVAQLSNNVNVQVEPHENFRDFEAVKESAAVEIIKSNLAAEFTIPSSNDLRPSVQENLRINLDVGNYLEQNSSVRQQENLENATDSVVAGSEHSFSHDINQRLEAAFLNSQSSGEELIDDAQSTRVSPPQDFSHVLESEEVTTTEGSYIVKFEPSLQTAADLAEKAATKSFWNNRNRLTPLELLDSPAQHATAFTSKPTESVPPFKPIEDYTKKLATLWTSPLPISTSTEATPTPTYETTQSTFTSSLSPAPTTTLSFLSQLSGGAFSGITPPREPAKPSPSTKKPKQIQIVIPYTTFHKPSPFKVQAEQETITYRTIRGHYLTHPTASTKKPARNDKKSPLTEESFSNDQEYLDHAQESKIVESKVTAEPQATTKYLTKILAHNIRDLLKKEKTPKPTKIDLIKLQKNIDGWTEQSFKGKASTISLMGHTKAIPKSFLSTTTMKAITTPTTTLSPRTTFDPDLMEETKRQYDNILYKKEDDDSLYVKRHDRYLNRDNELVLLNNNLTYNSLHDGVKVFAPKTTLTPKELWKRLHLTISPLTNEKIYVVTPQPSSAAETLSTFKPRFAVRPTVAGMKHPKKLKPEMFGRMENGMDLSNIETVDGHSKVVRIITPTQNAATTSMEVTSEKSSV